MTADPTPHDTSTPAQSTPEPPVPAEDADQDDREDGLTVSEAGSSFSDPETAQGGADAVPSTPDSTPRENHRENADLVDDDLLA
ncbi:hypothetical protein [Lapillicoccus jejuensis]|uniref:Uncharacterized protein n=1 Tax=Lapillicoccus jejuensis TaxID=402171 RepID=A0A542DYA5_9MICO|nr:hypothetical protein [Lapillicoccus jejuensis]TQJ08065.1 hypothetical protein FB458_1144 [Lapillicoccus jejuensis]